jgi:hypothetical protein
MGAAGNRLIIRSRSVETRADMVATEGAVLELIGVDVSLDLNHGPIRANDSIVVLRDGTRVRTGQLIAAGSGVFMQPSGHVELDDVYIIGPYDMFGGTTLGLRGEWSFQIGTLTVNSDDANEDTTLVLQGPAAILSGTGGVVVLSHPVHSILTTAPGVVGTHAAEHVVRGAGRVDGTIVNHGRMEGFSTDSLLQIEGVVLGAGPLENVLVTGTHSPGEGPAAVEVEGSYSFSPTGRLAIDIAGSEPGIGHDQVNASGSVSLDGEVFVTFPGDDRAVFIPSSGSRFEILTSASEIVGLFDRVMGSPFGVGAEFRLVHEPNRVLLEVLDPYLIGDYDESRLVEQGDLDLVLLHWGQDAATPPSEWTNDLPSGVIDQAELDGVLLNWGNTIAQSEMTSAGPIPEPSSSVVLIIACAVLLSPFATRPP